jgi:phosphohistidine phosphatase
LKRLRRHLKASGAAPSLALCSSARRTVMTWEGIRAAFPGDVTVAIEDGLYAASRDRLLRRLRAVDDDVVGVLLIGHNPGVEDLADTLIGAGDTELRRRLEAKFPTGALAELSFQGPWADLQPGAATLVSFVVPRDLPG